MALPKNERFSLENINRKIDIMERDGYKCFEYKKDRFYILGESNEKHLLKKRAKAKISAGLAEAQMILSDGNGYIYESVLGTRGDETFLVSLETIPKS